MPDDDYRASNHECTNCTLLRYDTLKERMDMLVRSAEIRLEQKIDGVQHGADKAERMQAERNAKLNEVREQLDRQAATFWTRELAESHIQRDRDEHIVLTERIQKLERWPWVIIGVFAVMQLVVTLIIKFW